MKIVIDARMLTWTGIGRYTKHLLTELQQQDEISEYHILLTRDGFATWEPTGTNFHKVLADFSPYSLTAQRRLPGLLKKLRPDLVHFTHFAVPLNYRGKYMVTIHDLTLLTHTVQTAGTVNRLRQTFKRPAMQRVLRQAIARSQAIITPSQFVKQQVVKGFNVAESKVVVTYEAAEVISAQPTPYEPLAEQKFILYVGNAYPYKNLERLIRAFGSLHHPDYRLVLVGKQDYFYRQLELFTQQQRIDNVVFTGFVSDNELAWLYRQASLFAFPSLSEGFGLPGLEAMQYGLPVAASDATSLPEVYGDAASYFNPTDLHDMGETLARGMSDRQLRQQLIEAGSERVKRFSWQRMAEQTLEAYHKTANDR